MVFFTNLDVNLRTLTAARNNYAQNNNIISWALRMRRNIDSG